MKAFVSAVSAAAPFIVGVVCGALLLYSLSLWAPDEIESVIGWLGAAGLGGVVLAMFVYLAGRIFLARPGNSLVSRLQALTDTIERNPEALSDKEFVKQNIWPLVPVAAKLAIGWFAIGGALALALALVTNVALMATLAVQYLQAERLEQQNRLIVVQSDAARISQEREVIKDIQQVALVTHEVGQFAANLRKLPWPTPDDCKGRAPVCDIDIIARRNFGDIRGAEPGLALLYKHHEMYISMTAYARKNPSDVLNKDEIADLVIRPAAVACAYGAEDTYKLIRLAGVLRGLQIEVARAGNPQLETKGRRRSGDVFRATFELYRELGLPAAEPMDEQHLVKHTTNAYEALRAGFEGLRSACEVRATDLVRMLGAIKPTPFEAEKAANVKATSKRQ